MWPQRAPPHLYPGASRESGRRVVPGKSPCNSDEIILHSPGRASSVRGGGAPLVRGDERGQAGSQQRWAVCAPVAAKLRDQEAFMHPYFYSGK